MSGDTHLTDDDWEYRPDAFQPRRPATSGRMTSCRCGQEQGMVIGAGVWTNGVLHTTQGCRDETAPASVRP